MKTVDALPVRRDFYRDLDETCFEARLSNGLTVKVVPKRDFSKKFAILATDYGSIDMNFVDRVGGQRTRHPAGIAHFLEHCLFAQQSGDICDEFSRLGASANAGTSFSSTSYLFSCSSNFRRNLNLLVDFVFTPYFTEAIVEKERGIIAQEIGMYEDSAEWRLFMNLLEGMYHRHPIRSDIVGTVDSIGEITPEMLRTCHETFYHPTNMVLLMVGDLDPVGSIEGVAKRMSRRNGRIPSAEPNVIRRVVPREPRTIRRKQSSVRLSVAHTKVLMGFKDYQPPGLSGRALTERDTATSLLLDVLLGKSSELYSRLYDDGLIDDSFSASYNADRSYAFTVIGGDTRDAKKLVDAVLKGIRQLKRRGIDRADFRRIRDKAYGRFFQSFNSIEGIAYTMMHHHFRGSDIDDQLKALKRIKKEDLEERAAEHLLPTRCTVSILRPKKGQ